MSQESEMSESLNDAIRRVASAATHAGMYRRWWKAEKEARIRRDEEIKRLNDALLNQREALQQVTDERDSLKYPDPRPFAGSMYHSFGFPVKGGDIIVDPYGKKWNIVDPLKERPLPQVNRAALADRIFELKMLQGALQFERQYDRASAVERAIAFLGTL